MTDASSPLDGSLLSPEEFRRVRQTVACRDTDELPKVPEAGRVLEWDGRSVQVMHNGVLVEAGGYFGGWMARIISDLRGHHEPQEELVFARVLERLVATAPSEPVAVELGSFWAYYSLWFLKDLGSGRVVALEPDPANLEVGRRNFALNDQVGTFVHGVMGLSPHGESDFANLDGSSCVVREYDLASLLDETRVDRVDLLLCDIQGGEDFVFRQATDLLRAGRVRFAIISTHHHSISGDPLTHQRLLDVLVDLGAHVIAEHSVGESCSGDGLIAVSFDERDRDLVVEPSRVRAADSLFGPLEYDLAATQERLTQRHAELDSAAVEAAAAQTRLQELEHEARTLQAELAQLRASRIFRWTDKPRAVYAAARRRRA